MPGAQRAVRSQGGKKSKVPRISVFRLRGPNSVPESHMAEVGFSVLILAGGKATRFKSDRPKLLHALAGRLLGEYVLRTAAAASPERIYMIVGYQAAE